MFYRPHILRLTDNELLWLRRSLIKRCKAATAWGHLAEDLAHQTMTIWLTALHGGANQSLKSGLWDAAAQWFGTNNGSTAPVRYRRDGSGRKPRAKVKRLFNCETLPMPIIDPASSESVLFERIALTEQLEKMPDDESHAFIQGEMKGEIVDPVALKTACDKLRAHFSGPEWGMKFRQAAGRQ